MIFLFLFENFARVLNSRAQNRPLLQRMGVVTIETDIIQRARVTAIQGKKQN